MSVPFVSVSGRGDALAAALRAVSLGLMITATTRKVAFGRRMRTIALIAPRPHEERPLDLLRDYRKSNLNIARRPAGYRPRVMRQNGRIKNPDSHSKQRVCRA